MTVAEVNAVALKRKITGQLIASGSLPYLNFDFESENCERVDLTNIFERSVALLVKVYAIRIDHQFREHAVVSGE